MTHDKNFITRSVKRQSHPSSHVLESQEINVFSRSQSKNQRQLSAIKTQQEQSCANESLQEDKEEIGQVVNLDFAAGYDCGDEPSEASSQPEDDGQQSISSIDDEQPDVTATTVVE